MAEIKSKIADLGKFEKLFQEIIKKYNLETKTDKIFDFLVQAILGTKTDLELSDLFIKELGLDFSTACDLAYDLKIQILDKKEDLAPIKKNLQTSSWQKYTLEAMVEEFLTKINYQLKDNILKKRFSEAILSWLKEVRDLSELKDILTKSEKIGGIGLPEQNFNQLQNLLLAKKEELKNEKIDINKIIADYQAGQKSEIVMPPEVAEEEIDVAAKAAKVAVAQEKPTGQEVTIDQLLKEKGVPYQELAAKEAIKRQLGEKERVLEVQGELAKEITAKEASFATSFAKASEVRKASEAIKEENPLVEEIEAREEFLESKEEIEPPDVPVPSPVPKAPAPPVQPKPQMPAPAETKFEVKQPLIRKTMPDVRPRVEDVKFTAQLVGPIDELAILKIEDFRRLAKEPEIAAKKIMAKLGLLEEESLTKKAEGIKALKSSPLYKVYSDIMNQAIKEGKSIEQVTEENPIITMAEFKAIMELNKSLKY